MEEQPGDVMEEQTAEAGGVEQAGNVEQDVEEYAGGMEYTGDVEQAGDAWEQVGQETFTVTPSAIVSPFCPSLLANYDISRRCGTTHKKSYKTI